MDGEIKVESAEGVGTKFIFTMVLNTVDERAPTPAPPLLADVPVQDKRCLVIEHSSMVRRLICRDIVDVGLESDDTADFATAQRHLEYNRYAIVIVDGSLPDTDAFIHEVGKLSPSSRIILTSNLGRVPELDITVVTTLIKPIRRWRLISSLEKALDRSPSITMQEASLLRGSSPGAIIRREYLASLAQRHPLRILVISA
jgi:DNA-binding NtrC family response regulator